MEFSFCYFSRKKNYYSSTNSWLVAAPLIIRKRVFFRSISHCFCSLVYIQHRRSDSRKDTCKSLIRVWFRLKTFNRSLIWICLSKLFSWPGSFKCHFLKFTQTTSCMFVSCTSWSTDWIISSDFRPRLQYNNCSWNRNKNRDMFSFQHLSVFWRWSILVLTFPAHER